MGPVLKALASQLPCRMVAWGRGLLVSVAPAPAQVPDTQGGFVNAGPGGQYLCRKPPRAANWRYSDAGHARQPVIGGSALGDFSS